MVQAKLLMSLEDLINSLRERVQDFPGPTCSDIDTVILDLRPITHEIDMLERKGTEANHAELVTAVAEVDLWLRNLPAELDDLRSANYQLRTSLHEALDNRKSVANTLEEIVSKIEDNQVPSSKQVEGAGQGRTFYCEDEDGVLRRWHPPRTPEKEPKP